jgi:glycosyltransferase involved in cell wall biosynthesis
LSRYDPTITFVLPWYGPRIPGGAEFQARRSAEELAARGVPVEVFTTVAGGVMSDWSTPAFAPGLDQLNGVAVRRFPVRPRRAALFDALNRRLLRGERLSLVDEAIFVREIIGSDALEAAIAGERHRRIYIFTPYMFGTSYWGARAAAERAYLIPCLHDEGYAELQHYRQLFEAARGLIFYSAAEQRLARRRYQIDQIPQLVLGGGVETALTGDADRFRAHHAVAGPFLLYAGRRDAGKNTPLLFDYFRRYRADGGTLQLVCIGGPGEPLPADLVAAGAAHDLGFLDPQAKLDAYAAALTLCQPSRNESFSVVLMEAWVCGTPGLVHSDCAVTRAFCEESGGGIHFRSAGEFAACLDWLQAHPDQARLMGRAGAAYVRRHFSWDTVLHRLLDFITSTSR